jgi:hypothetical protein
MQPHPLHHQSAGSLPSVEAQPSLRHANIVPSFSTRWGATARVLWFGLGVLTSQSAQAQSVLAERYNDARTGANLAETQLTTANVNVTQFGKLFSQTVSGSTQAQLLYLPNVAIPGKGTHNVIFVATMNDVLYAFDADSNTGANASALWVHDFTNAAAGITPVPIADIVGSNSLNIVGNVGIESTPVIDPASNVMYLVARTKENGSYVQRLHAVAVETGADLPGSPVTISGSAGGATFDPKIHNQRSSLALANGKVFIAWASHEDKNAYHGWVMAYDASTLTNVGVFCVAPNSGGQGGIWMAGCAPAVDASGNVYYVSGNGSWNGTTEFGESVLKFNTATGLALADWFTPDNWAALNSSDYDMGCCGALLIPGTNLIVATGKAATFFLLNTGSLGHEQTGNGQIVQHFQENTNGGASGAPKGGLAYWNRTTGAGPWMYVWAENDFLKAFHFNGSTFVTTPASQGTVKAPSGSSAGVLALSANGSTAGTGIVWASIPINQNADHGVVNGMLRAFDANDLTKELWNSQQNSTRDATGTWPKFSPPVVVNGKVYLGSFSNKITVYGLLSTTPQVAAPTFTPGGGSYSATQSVTVATTTTGASIRYTTDGSAPSETAGTLYSGPVTISATATLKAIAYESGFTDSTVTSALYTIGSTPPTFNFEAESLTYTPNGATASVQTDTKSSGGHWIELVANSVGDYIDYAIPSVPAGTYQVQMEWKGNNNRGILNLKVDGTQLGGALDQYSAAQSYPTTTFGTITFASTGTHTIRLTVTGKNSASSNYYLSADKFTLIGQ